MILHMNRKCTCVDLNIIKEGAESPEDKNTEIADAILTKPKSLMIWEVGNAKLPFSLI